MLVNHNESLPLTNITGTCLLNQKTTQMCIYIICMVYCLNIARRGVMHVSLNQVLGHVVSK